MNTDELLGMLLEAIDYSFLQIDGHYDKVLTYPVIDKIQYIKEQLKDVEVQEEPVSEDLEKAAQEYVTKEGYLAGLFYYSMVRSFKAGAKWQKQQDQSTIELAEDHAMLAGIEKAENLKKLADAMYNAAQNMTTDASQLRKAMDEYRQYVVQEYYDKGIRL